MAIYIYGRIYGYSFYDNTGHVHAWEGEWLSKGFMASGKNQTKLWGKGGPGALPE